MAVESLTVLLAPATFEEGLRLNPSFGSCLCDEPGVCAAEIRGSEFLSKGSVFIAGDAW